MRQGRAEFLVCGRLIPVHGWGSSGAEKGRYDKKIPRKGGKRELRKTLIPAVMGLVALAGLAGPAFAANVHLKGGARAEPSFTDN